MNVVDSKNVSYQVVEKIGEGSQGITYLLEDRKHIVKLFKGQVDAASIKSKINFLINLGLDKNIFAIPLRQITQPKNGYIAEFASGMMPLSGLRFSGGQDLAEWYQATGGLFKRYNILIQLAAMVRALHSKGLAYCDLSPNNIFISAKKEVSNVFLIDLDNLRYKTSIIHNIYTPTYGAPEVVSSLAPNTTMSDSYAFGVIAYELLTWNHPLIGDYVSDGDPELEELAMAGKLPWVEHSQDPINARTTGLPSEQVMPENLRMLFRQNFEEGLNEPLKRPSMAQWFDGLSLALNELLQCGNVQCGLYYPFNNYRKCTFCGYEPNQVTRIQMRRWEEIETYQKDTNTIQRGFCLEPTVYDEILIDENTAKDIAAFNFLMMDKKPLEPIINIKHLRENQENKIMLSPLGGIHFHISPRISDEAKKPLLLNSPRKIRVVDKTQSDKQKYMLHLRDLNTPQRVLTID